MECQTGQKYESQFARLLKLHECLQEKTWQCTRGKNTLNYSVYGVSSVVRVKSKNTEQ